MFVCVICEAKRRRKFEICPNCKAPATCAPFAAPRLPRLSSIEAKEAERFDCGIDWNEALGGGVVRGGVVLIASRGGSGKTTEMLRVAARLGTPEEPAYYFFSERTEEELAAQAVLIEADRARIVALGPITTIDDLIEHTPTGAHVFLDSWGNLESADPKDIARIREIEPASAWIICHVNKRGDLEGREKLAHAASAVVWVRRNSLRTSKNWHGPQRVTDRLLPAAFATAPRKPKPARKLRAV